MDKWKKLLEVGSNIAFECTFQDFYIHFVSWLSSCDIGDRVMSYRRTLREFLNLRNTGFQYSSFFLLVLWSARLSTNHEFLGFWKSIYACCVSKYFTVWLCKVISHFKRESRDKYILRQYLINDQHVCLPIMRS